MKKSKYIIVILCLAGLMSFGQDSAVHGVIKEVRPYKDQYAMNIGNTVLVLIKDVKDTSGNSFEINAEYKDLLVKKKGRFVLNPKYARKKLTILYYVNGKGWKCIKEIEPAKKKSR